MMMITRWGAYSAPPDPLAVFKGPTSKGTEGKDKGGENRGTKGKGERTGRCGAGRDLASKNFGVAPPMQTCLTDSGHNPAVNL